MQFTPEQEKYFSVGKTHNRQGDLSREQIEALNQMLKESYVLAHLGRVQGAVNAAGRGVSRVAVPTLNAARAAGRSVANLGSSALTSARNQLNSVASKVPFGNMLTKQRALPKFLGGRPATSVAQLTDDAAQGVAGRVDDAAPTSLPRTTPQPQVADDVAQTSIPRSNPAQRVEAVPQTQQLSPTQAPQPRATAPTQAPQPRATAPTQAPQPRATAPTQAPVAGTADDAAQATARSANAGAQSPRSFPPQGSPEFVERESIKRFRNSFPEGSPARANVQRELDNFDAAYRLGVPPNRVNGIIMPPGAPKAPATQALGQADDAAQRAAGTADDAAAAGAPRPQTQATANSGPYPGGSWVPPNSQEGLDRADILSQLKFPQAEGRRNSLLQELENLERLYRPAAGRAAGQAAGAVDDVAARAAGQMDDGVARASTRTQAPVAGTADDAAQAAARPANAGAAGTADDAAQAAARPANAGAAGTADDAAQAAARPANAGAAGTADDAAQAAARPANAQPPTAPTALPVKNSPEYTQMRENLKAQRDALPKKSRKRKAIQKQIDDLEKNAPRSAQNPAQAAQTPAAPNAAGAADDAAAAGAAGQNPRATVAATGMTPDDTAAFKAAVGDDTYNLFFGNTLREGATVKTKIPFTDMKAAPNWLKNMWTGRGITQGQRADDVRSIQALLKVEADAIAATRGGLGTAATLDDRINAAKAIELAVKNNRTRPTELLKQYQASGTSISTNAVSPASSQGRAALAAQQAADDATAAARAEAAKGTGLMEWANKNPIPAAILGGAGILAVPRLVNGGGGSTIVT